MDILLTYLPLILVLGVIGAVAGFLAGLLGIGGGIVLVPGLYYSLTYLGYDPGVMMHVAIGTSLAVIIPTGLSSVLSHWKKESVRPDLVKRIGIGIVLGVVLGTFLADVLSGEMLKIIFAAALIVLAGIMVSNPARYTVFNDVPGQPGAALGGIVIGTLSTLMGIGGATVSVPFMTVCKTPIHQAVGTASALGLVIAVPAALGFVIIGWGEDLTPPFSLGYVNMLAWLLIVPVSVSMAPLGAKMAHSVSVDLLRLIFAGFIVVVAMRMMYGVLFA